MLAAWYWKGPIVFVLTIAAMELVAYATHRWLMHGPGWFLHKSHHRPRTGRFETNDAYAVLFALPSMLLLYGGVNLAWGGIAVWAGAGIAGYGLIYFGFHDVLVHRRLWHAVRPRSRYLKRIIQAHRLHYVTRGKRGAVSFGFLVAPRPRQLRRQLREARAAA